MIVVSVHLISARDGSHTELARMEITNDGTGTAGVGNYTTRTLRGRSSTALSRRIAQRTGTVAGWPRLALHVWNLVAEALRAMGYGRPTETIARKERNVTT